MSAQYVDALKGYEFYLSQRGKASIDAVNKFLIKEGRSPIKTRTYVHYRKLLAKGFRSYIPINKFDVFQSLGRLQMISDRRRYAREDVEILAQISRDKQKRSNCTVIDKSLVGFGIVTSNRFPCKPGTQLWLHLRGYNDIPVMIAWRSHETTHTRLGLRAFEFVAKYQISDIAIDEKRLKGLLRVAREEDTTIQWDELVRILDKTDQLLTAVSDLIYSVGEYSQVDIRLARAILDSIKFGSPGEAQVKIDLGIADLLRVIIEKIQFFGLEKRKLRVEIDKAELENQSMMIENYRNAINLGKEISKTRFSKEIKDELEKPIADLLGLKQLPAGAFEEGSIEESILSERVLPAAAELIAGDDLDFTIIVSTD